MTRGRRSGTRARPVTGGPRRAWQWPGVVTLAMAGGAFALGCADFDVPVDPTGGAPDVLVPNPSFSANVEPIFEKRCAVGGCHSLATRQADLVLAPGVAYEALVGVPATRRPSMLRVMASRPDSSWLVAMIGPDAGARPGYSRMPLASRPLTENQIATIVRWIEQGAQRN